MRLLACTDHQGIICPVGAAHYIEGLNDNLSSLIISNWAISVERVAHLLNVVRQLMPYTRIHILGFPVFPKWGIGYS